MQTLTVLLSIQLNTGTELHSRHAPSKLDWLNQHQRAWQQGAHQGFPEARLVGRKIQQIIIGRELMRRD
jgi:hypothetical protein